MTVSWISSPSTPKHDFLETKDFQSVQLRGSNSKRLFICIARGEFPSPNPLPLFKRGGWVLAALVVLRIYAASKVHFSERCFPSFFLVPFMIHVPWVFSGTKQLSGGYVDSGKISSSHKPSASNYRRCRKEREDKSHNLKFCKQPADIDFGWSDFEWLWISKTEQLRSEYYQIISMHTSDTVLLIPTAGFKWSSHVRHGNVSNTKTTYHFHILIKVECDMPVLESRLVDIKEGIKCRLWCTWTDSTCGFDLLVA